MTLTAPWRFEASGRRRRGPSARGAKTRRLGAERAEDVDLARRVVDVVVAADHVRDAHVEVVDDDAEVVGRHAVGAQRCTRSSSSALAISIRPFTRSSQATLPSSGFLKRITGARPAGGVCRRVLGPPAAVVARLFAARDLLRAQRVELLASSCSSDRRGPRASSRSSDLAVALHALHLEERAFVVVEAEPRHRVEDRLHRLPAWSARGRCPRCAG